MLNRKIASAVALATGVMMSGQALAALEGNVAATSNYLWRGITQTAGGAAVSGGVDYGHDSGAYAGAWVSNIDSDTEVDLYAGFSGEVSGIGYDLGYISYVYPASKGALDFSEIYVGASYSMLGLTYYMDSENENSYIDVSAEMEVSDGLTVAAHYGTYAFDLAPAGDYSDYSVSLTKALDGWDWTMAVSDTDADPAVWGAQNEEMQITVSFSKGFDL